MVKYDFCMQCRSVVALLKDHSCNDGSNLNQETGFDIFIDCIDDSMLLLHVLILVFTFAVDPSNKDHSRSNGLYLNQ